MSPSASGGAGSGSTRRAVIGPELTVCATHVDCTLVDTLCNACCLPGAIASDQMTEFREALADACRGHGQGGVCDCVPPDVVARCYDQRCVAVPRAEVVECFSPARDAWQAFEDGGVGCPCDGDEPRTCASEGALECTSMPTGTSAWQGVEDASCIPRKLGDAVDAADPDAVTVNLFVIPANGPLVSIDVWLDDVHVVTGSFDYGPSGHDPGRTYPFELSVAGPEVTLRAETTEAMVEHTFDAPAERWVVLRYDLDKTASEPMPRLLVDVSDRPLGFD